MTDISACDVPPCSNEAAASASACVDPADFTAPL
jgi:hypothetical protein